VGVRHHLAAPLLLTLDEFTKFVPCSREAGRYWTEIRTLQHISCLVLYLTSMA